MTRRFLGRLQAIHPEFRYWESLGKSRFQPLEHNWADLEEHLRVMARPKKNLRSQYSGLDEHFDVTAETRSDDGFMLSLFTTDAGGGPSDGQDHARPDIVHIRISGGRGATSLSMELPASRPDLMDGSVMRQVVDAVLDVFQAGTLQVLPPQLRERYSQGVESRSQVRAGWFTYVRHSLLASCLPLELPCPVDVSPDGGMLFTLTPHMPDPENDADVEKARALQQFFDQLHFDHSYVLDGWPSDEADVDYAKQVTGAPRDRKYAVAFCAFDGYDAQRKVLIYAKLFRQFVDDILQPYFIEDAQKIEGLPFLVQARHQIAAVEYAGANTPIEWHVGIEDNARDLAKLLNELGGIPTKKLSVIYTPFSP